MWGNRRRRSTYYSCQPSHQRSKDISADHPPHVYLNEERLNAALLLLLATALFGPERTGYWRTCLDAAAEPEAAAPAQARTQEIEAETADLERRLTRQLVNLEADDVTSALRRRVGQRVADWRTPSPSGASGSWHSSGSRRQRRPRWPTSPRCSTGYQSSPTGWPRRLRAGYGRCSTP